jgi:hypothetical protein
MVEKTEEYFVTRYELECKLREMDKKMSASSKESGDDATIKNGFVIDRADKDTRASDKKFDDINARLVLIGDRLDKFFIAIVGIAITTLISIVLILVQFVLKS